MRLGGPVILQSSKPYSPLVLHHPCVSQSKMKTEQEPVAVLTALGLTLLLHAPSILPWKCNMLCYWFTLQNSSLWTAPWALVFTVLTPVSGISDRAQQSKTQSVFCGFTGTLPSNLLRKFSCTYSICKSNLGLKRIFEIWSVMAKRKGVSFSPMQGLTTSLGGGSVGVAGIRS